MLGGFRYVGYSSGLAGKPVGFSIYRYGKWLGVSRAYKTIIAVVNHVKTGFYGASSRFIITYHFMEIDIFVRS